MSFVCRIFTMSSDGERDGLWWPALSGHWLSYTGFGHYFELKILIMGYCFFNCPPLLDVSVHGLSFRKMDWNSFYGPPLYDIYILYLG